MLSSATVRVSVGFLHPEAVRYTPRPPPDLEVHPGCLGCHPGNYGTSARGARMVCGGVPSHLPGPPYPPSTHGFTLFYPQPQNVQNYHFCSKRHFLIKTAEMTLTRRTRGPTYGENCYGTESLFVHPVTECYNPPSASRKPDQ